MAFEGPGVVPPYAAGYGVPFGAGGGLGVPFGAGAGLGGGLNIDASGGLGFGAPGLLGGVPPGWGGWSGPYVPVTPLGALEGFKGDLLVPVITIGVAVFLLVLIILAVKYALAWKLSVLEDLSGSKKFLREAPTAAAPQLQDDYLIPLAKLVTDAIYSGSCSERMVCQVGAMARGNAETVNALSTLVQSYLPMSFQSYLNNLKSSAEGAFDCSQRYPCGHDQSGMSSSSTTTSTTTPSPTSSSHGTTPRPSFHDVVNNNSTSTNEVRPQPQPSKFGRFRRGSGYN